MWGEEINVFKKIELYCSKLGFNNKSAMLRPNVKGTTASKCNQPNKSCKCAEGR